MSNDKLSKPDSLLDFSITYGKAKKYYYPKKRQTNSKKIISEGKFNKSKNHYNLKLTRSVELTMMKLPFLHQLYPKLRKITKNGRWQRDNPSKSQRKSPFLGR